MSRFDQGLGTLGLRVEGARIRRQGLELRVKG